MRLRWSADAHRDLTDIHERAERRNPPEAAKLADRIECSDRMVAASPRAGRRDVTGGFRRWPVPRTRVVLTCRRDGDAAIILAAFRSSRDPRAGPGRR